MKLEKTWLLPKALKEEGLLVIPLSRRSRDRVSRHGLGSDPAAVNGAVEMAVYRKHAEVLPPCFWNSSSKVRLLSSPSS